MSVKGMSLVAMVLIVSLRRGYGQDASCPRRLTKISAHINSVCCMDGVDCSGGAPDSCTRDCAALWMPFYQHCSEFAATSLGDLDAFSHMCIETAYGGAGGHACDETYLHLALNDISLACHCDTAACGLTGGYPESLAQCSPSCLAEFSTVYERCQGFLQNPALQGRGNIPAWEAILSQCQADEAARDTGGEAGSSCEAQCAFRFSRTGEADVCACVYGCHDREAGADAATCTSHCDNSCDDDDECDCRCGSAGTCTECSSQDECETPCAVGCSLNTELTHGFSGLTTGHALALDTAEENVATGEMYTTSSDLELLIDNDHEQIVAIRFGPVNIPAGSRIYSASVQFAIDEVKAEADLPITIAIFAEARDNAAALTETSYDISSRTPTESSRIWRPPTAAAAAGAKDYSLCWELNHCSATPWSIVGAQVETPNMAGILQEVIDRDGWVAGNSVAVLFAQLSGVGVRTVESGGIILNYEYDVTPPENPPPRNECGAAGDGLHGAPTCEESHIGRGCGACPFGAEGDPDLMPAGWSAGAAQRCIVPENDVFVGGTRLCYCHGHVSNGVGGQQSCEEFGTEWYRNYQSGHYAEVDFEFLVRPESCTPAEAGSGAYVCTHDHHDTVLLSGTEDSAEQDAAEGSMYLTSTDLELMHDATTAEACPSCPGGGSTVGSEQVVALRFNNVQIPRGAAITEAHIGFEIDEVNEPQSSLPVVIGIYGEYSGDAAPPADVAFDLSRRPNTERAVTWSPPAAEAEPDTWGTVGGVVSSPSVVGILEEITSHPAWRPGNSLMFLFGHVSGAGVRWMVSAEDNDALHGGPFLSYSFEESTGYASIQAAAGTEAGSSAQCVTMPDGSCGHSNAVRTSNSVEEVVTDGSMYLDSSVSSAKENS